MRRWILLWVLSLPFFAMADNIAAEGYYVLVNGTQGCPHEVKWDNQCHGFTLSPMEQGRPQETVYFCHINKGPWIKSEEHKKIFTQVVRQGYITRKKEITSYPSPRGTLTQTAEDSVMLDREGRLLWDHNKNEQGLSCLYSHQQ